MRIQAGWTWLGPCVLALAGCAQRPTAQEPVETVQVRQPARVERKEVVRVGGNVEPYESAEVGFQVAGRIRRVLVEEGQAVARGQLLA
ncbi:MAG: hypothetical protein ACUVS7_10675, partial [Bryobacteraceae bacterium]